MKTYVQSLSTSCVFDAFMAANLPISNGMLYGITDWEVARLLKEYGYTVYTPEHSPILFPDNIPFFIATITDERRSHLEYHVCKDENFIKEYPQEKISFIAIK